MAPKIDYNAPDAEWYDDVPRSVSRLVVGGILLLTLTFGGFGLWAFRAPLAAAVIAQGSFVATGQNKIIQHLEGGIIKNIMVSEGDTVEAGQLLMKLDETAASANERELFLRQMRLEATETRLLAEYNQSPILTFGPSIMAEANDPEILAILDGQELSFRVSRSALESDLSLLQTNVDALEIRSIGYVEQLASHESQFALLSEEAAGAESLLEKGLTRRSQVNALRRTLLEATGQMSRLQAQVDEIEQIKQKYVQEAEQVRNQYGENALNQLQRVQAELDSVREQIRAVTSVRERVDVLAPVSGTIVRMHYHTSGGVVESGRPIAEILPSDEPLIIETQILRADIDSVLTNQFATVRLTSLNQRTTPILHGEVFYISADAVSDTSSGQLREVYIARVSLSPDEIRRVPGFTPTPGMPAEIMIQTEERTFAQYIARPIKDSMIRAFREN